MESTDEARLEVCLVPKAEVGHLEEEFWVEVESTKTKDGKRYLQFREEVSDISMLNDVLLDGYYIVSVRLKSEQKLGSTQERYSTVAEDQNEAFEAIQGLLADETGFQVLESQTVQTIAKVAGPRRVEILVQTMSMPHRMEKLVVIHLLPPANHFSSITVHGRRWNKIYATETLEPQTTIIHANTHILLDVTRIDGGLYGKTRTDRFNQTQESQVRGWAFLEKEYESLKTVELTVAQRWTPTPAYSHDDDGAYGEGTHWTGNLPHAYRTETPKAFFRVSGDEIGAVIHRTQQDKLLEQQVKQEEKAEAAADQPAETTQPGNDEDEFCDCKSPACDVCYYKSYKGGPALRAGFLVH